MAEVRFAEHYRIDQYLKKRSMRVIKAKTFERNENQLSNFPVGLIIITSEGLIEEKLEFINQYACKLFKLNPNADINNLKEKFSEYVRLKNNYLDKTSQSLKDVVFKPNSFNLDLDNFIPFESNHSKTSILYIKINDIDNEKYIVIDKYDKYIEERKYIEFNLIKAINYQYLHTLYHELNNPLNALLALSGESQKFEQTEINGSRIYEKSPILEKKSLNKIMKKERKTGLLSLNSSKNNRLFTHDCKDEAKPRKRSIDETNNDRNNRISLLVNIIKVFIKNFILYLKTRSDNLLLLKNEYEQQYETSDIMNAVEVSDYERELTKHKSVKINLEYILELYLQKYLCLFKYKGIEFDTHFEKLKHLFVLTDEFNFSYYIRQIYTYLYYVVPKKEGFKFQYTFESNQLKILIKKKPIDIFAKKDFNHRISFKEEGFKMEQVIQTKEMTKEVLYAISKKLHFNIQIYDIENNKEDNYLLITLPIEKREESEDNDDFKDEDINEMVGKDALFLEEKLKRQLPSNSVTEGHKTSNISTIKILDLLSKSGEEVKLSLDSLTSINKTNNIKCKSQINNSQKNSENFVQKKLSTVKNNSNSSILSKYIKSNEQKKTEKSKFMFNSNNNISESLLVNKKNFKNKRSYSSLEGKSGKNGIGENILKSQKTHEPNGIFTLINKNGLLEEYDDIGNQKSEISIVLCKNKKDEMTFKEKSDFVSGYGSSIKGKIINESKIVKKNDDENTLSNTNSKRPSFFGRKKPSIVKTSCFITDINGDNGLNKNNPVLLFESEKDKQNSNFGKKSEKDYKYLKTIKEENDKILKSSNIIPLKKRNTKKSYDEEKKDYYKNTLIDNGAIDNENEKLFLKAIKESKFHIQQNKKKYNKEIKLSKSSEKRSKNKSESDFLFNSVDQCNCADILVVDDEEFNVMASQRMLKNLGFESDSAYNGEECINLINEKLNLNCKCESNYYKLIFLDIVMPVMDGIETAKTIQEMIDNKKLSDKTKIIFISGNIDNSKLKNSLLEIKCVKECLQKPVKISKYEKILEKYYND